VQNEEVRVSNFPKQARVVVIGAGIVGNAIVYHLAEKGWRDLVLLDKGPLPNPGGSTGHASNFIFPVDHSKGMTHLTQDSMRQFKELGVFTECGGIELARTAERVEELKRKLGSARAWGEPAELVTPAEIKRLMPFVNTDILVGGLWNPTVGVVDSLRAGTLMREHAQRLNALTIFANVEVTGMAVKNGRIASVQTDRGEIETEYVVIAAGVWSPRLAKMAGATIPLTPAVHQMISVGPIPQFADSKGEIEYPILRDMTPFMYERQNGNDLEIGSYAHRPILHEPDEIPSNQEAKLSPTEMPFTAEDFDPQMEEALELLPELLDNEKVGVRHAINGLLSLTPDGAPLLGETVEVKGLWSAAAVWIKEGPGVGRLMAEWMVDGSPEIDPHESDISRFYNYARSKSHIHARTSEGYNKTYGIIHPREQWESSRDIRLSPFYAREKELGAVFFETAGWERPHWYESNEKLLAGYAGKILERPAEWDSRWWSPVIQAEHLAMRERVAMVDLTAFAIFDLCGAGALDYVQKMAVFQMDVPVGRAVYTPLLDPRGGFRADLTIVRLGTDHFRVVTGGGDGARDKKWFQDHLPADGSVQLHDLTSSLCTVGLWGPRARDLLQSVTEDDLSNDAFPFATARRIAVGPVDVWALRISYVGELGWELYAPMEQGQHFWDILWRTGQQFGVVPVGIGVYANSGRLEKGYRLFGSELEMDYNPFEAGLARRRVKSQWFLGKEAYLKARAEDPAAILCTLTVDDHTSAAGIPRYMQGNEPILTAEGDSITDAKGRHSYVTSAGTGPCVGKHILMAYLPPAYAQPGTKLAVQYFGEQYPVTVEIAGNTALFDPGNERMKG
jgi:glycine cleavage system aminomethyltransferase T/glycine/D-amino acid oxidase-like deaminating enzyme